MMPCGAAALLLCRALRARGCRCSYQSPSRGHQRWRAACVSTWLGEGLPLCGSGPDSVWQVIVARSARGAALPLSHTRLSHTRLALLPRSCRLITYWPARSMLTHFRRKNCRRNSKRALPVNREAAAFRGAHFLKWVAT